MGCLNGFKTATNLEGLSNRQNFFYAHFPTLKYKCHRGFRGIYWMGIYEVDFRDALGSLAG
jgi:hypothetical protein